MTASPRPAASRHLFVDALRGLSLLGILAVNVEYMVQLSDLGWSNYTTTTDQIVRWLVITFGSLKVYPLFALLFGYGLALQVASAERSGTELWPRYRRRMVGLLVLGALHGIFFFIGDILGIYAVTGAIAYRFRHAETRRLLRLAVAVYGGASLLWIALGLLDLAAGGSAKPSPDLDLLATLSSGSWAEVAGANVGQWLETQAFLVFLQGPAAFACFLAGTALGRTTLLSDPEAHLRHAKRVLTWAPIGFAIAGIAGIMSVAGGRWETLGLALGFASAPVLTMAYIAVLALAIGGRSNWLGRILQASGRMSLTAYLGESIVVSTLAYGFGAGWIGRVSPLEGIVLTLVVWLALSAFSTLWLKFARFGPLEWLLRSFTYGQVQPMLRARGPSG